MSSGGGSQTVTNKTEIDPITQQWRTDLMNAGRGLYQQGFPEYYPGQTVVPFADQTMQGLNMLTQQAQAGAPQYQNAVNAAGRSFEVNPALAGAQGWAGGANPMLQGVQQAGQAQTAQQVQGAINPSWAQALANSGQQQTTMGVGALQAQTQGGVNPALKGLFDQGAQDIANAVDSRFAMAGRYGDNAARGGAMTREIGNLWNQVYMPAYENQQNRSMQAGSALAGIQAGDRAAAMQGLGAAGQLNLGQAGLFGDALNADASRGLQGASTAAGLGLQGQGLAADIWSQGNMDTQRMAAIMPSLYQYGSAPAQQLLGVGGAYEGLAGEYLADDMTRYNYPYQGAWDHLNRYSAITSGLPDFSNNATTSPVNRNRALGAMGGAMSGAEVGKNFGNWGTLIGAIGGGLFGAYA